MIQITKKEVLLFAGGLIVGSLVTYIFCRCSRRPKVKDMDEQHGFYPVEEPEVEAWKESKETIETDYSNLVDEMYSGHQEEGVTHYTPYVISPDDYYDESYEDYFKRSLTYYADGVLADDLSDEVIKDPEDLIGSNALNSFGEYEEDTVYVRDDAGEVQYQINRDSAKYVDVVGPVPEDDDE